MRVRRSLAVAVLALAVAATPGCIGLSGPRTMKTAVIESSGVHLEPVMGLDVGRVALWAGLGIASSAAGVDLSRGHVSRLEIGVYEIDERQLEDAGRRYLLDRVRIPGWEPCITIRDGDDEVRVFLQQRRDRLEGLAVLTRDDDEVVIVRMRGRLGPIFGQVFALAMDSDERSRVQRELRAEADRAVASPRGRME